MLAQLKVSLYQAFAYRRDDALSLRNIFLGGRRRKGVVLAAALLLGALNGLSGCKFDDNRQSFTQSILYKKKVRPAEINSLSSKDVINAPPELMADSKAATLPTPKPADGASHEDAPLGSAGADDGEHATGWTGMYDVYWKLNWACKELLGGNVPHDLALVVTSTRKHCKRLANEFPKPNGMDERLEVAHRALASLDNGLQQMNNLATLEEAGLDWRAMPWGAGIDEMHRYLQRIGLATPTAKSSSAVSTSLSENEDAGSAVKSEEAPAYVTSHQREAIALALRCERENHASPEELARAQFQAAMRDIVRLRDLCGLTYHPVSVPGASVIIAGPLHLETASAAQSSSRFENANKAIAPGIAPGFDPTAPPGQSRNTPFIR